MKVKNGGASMFDAIYADENVLKEFLHAMGGVQAGNFDFFARNFDFSTFKTHCDVGGSGGNLSIHIAKNNPHLSSTTFDLPPVEPIASGNIKEMGLSDRISAKAGDFFTDDIPSADLITMGNILTRLGNK